MATPDADWQVPAFDVKELSGKRHEYCLCIFVIDEGERIRSQLRKIRKIDPACDIIIADGGSTDGSLDEEHLRACGVRTLLTKRGPGKLSAQMRMAFAYALREGYEGIVVMDGNDKDNPISIPLFLEALRGGCDHVQGSRFIKGGKHENTPMERLLAIKFLHAPLLRLASGFPYTDTTNGFRAYSRGFLLDLCVQPMRDVFAAYELHYYLAIRAADLGFDVREIPVERSYPSSGNTPTKIHSWQGKLKVLLTLLRVCLRQYHPRAKE